ncbi:MAG: 30S ribosomal protein S4, partial [Rhodospirillaceae bacterium]|nr:30S ribosomal protein S4 [Rhodospirillaceae bacterium]
QVVNHGHVTVNGKTVNIPSYMVKEGDIVELKSKSLNMPMVIEALNSSEREVPDYMDVDTKQGKGKFVRTPAFADVPYPVQMEPNLVIEFYSR